MPKWASIYKYNKMKTYPILKLFDGGCKEHGSRELTLTGSTAELVDSIFHNLPQDGDCRVFICAGGHTHRIAVDVAFSAELVEAEALMEFVSRLA